MEPDFTEFTTFLAMAAGSGFFQSRLSPLDIGGMTENWRIIRC